MKSPIAPLRLVLCPIFFSRWLQLPLYVGLIIAQVAYAYLFVIEVWHLVSHLGDMNKAEIILTVPGLIDVAMISSLLIMVVIGGYGIFMSKLGIEGHEDEPKWLDHASADVLKVKLSMALISISLVHLLKTFIDVAQKDTRIILWQVTTHVALLISASAMAWMDRAVSHAHPYGEATDTH